MICRILTAELSVALGQPIIVDNKPDASGNNGMQELVTAAPDGYTLGYGNVGALAINQSPLNKLPYDRDKQLAPVSLLGYVRNALVGKANHGRSVQTLELLQAAAPGQPLCIDCYPYHASSTTLLPRRVLQTSDIWVTWSEAKPAVAGRSLLKLALERGVTPEALAVALQPAGAI